MAAFNMQAQNVKHKNFLTILYLTCKWICLLYFSYAYLLLTQPKLRNFLQKGFYDLNPVTTCQDVKVLVAKNGNLFKIYCSVIFLIGSQLFETFFYDWAVNKQEIGNLKVSMS